MLPVARLSAALTLVLCLTLHADAQPPGIRPGDSYHLIFVTSATTTLTSSTTVPPSVPGNWGGLAAGDWTATFFAFNAGLVENWNFVTPVWQAVLSTGSENAFDRLNIQGPIYDTADQLIATDKNDLFDGSIEAAINHDEFGNLISGTTVVWTGTSSSGVWGGDSCNDWTTASSSQIGVVGILDSTSSSWALSSTRVCNSSARLYALSPLLTVPLPDLPGDYDGNEVINAADYTVWRDNLGAPAGTLLNDADGGVIGANHYNTWRTNFGNSLAQSANAVSVPEPTGVSIIAAALLATYTIRLPSLSCPNAERH